MKTSINLLPKKGLQEEHERERKRWIFVLAICIAIVGFLSWFIPFLFLQRARAQEEEIFSQIDQKEQSIKNLAQVESLYTDVFSKASGASMILQERKDFLAKVESIKALINAGVHIRAIAISADTIKMTVTGDDIGAVIAYIRSLEDNRTQKLFGNLTISSINIGNAGGFEVKIEGAHPHE